MRQPLFLAFVTAALAAVLLSVPGPGVNAQEAVPREPPPGDGTSQAGAGERRAVPKAQAPPAKREAEQGRAEPRRAPQPAPRRESPRRNDIPPRRLVGPRVYDFPPVDARIGFYYHPYFGFYYGPYYGPFYPYSGPYVWPARYTNGAIRTRVRPVETEVYVQGYFAGVVDDFDGLFQRLYLPTGQYEIELRLDGYRSFSRHVYVAPGDTLDVAHEMERLPAGQATAPPPPPQTVAGGDVEPAETGGGAQPASPYGMLAIRVVPADAQVLVDGVAWPAIAGLSEIVIHLPAGPHQLDVRKDGYQPFTTTLELAEGQTTRLGVSLARRPSAG